MRTITYDCTNCKFGTPLKFIPEIILDLASNIFSVLGYIVLCKELNDNITDKCANSNLGIYMCIIILNAFGKSYDMCCKTAVLKAKNIDINDYPLYYINEEYQEALKTKSILPTSNTNTISIHTTSDLPLFKFLFNVGFTIWGFFELFNNECIIDNFQHSYLYRIALFGTIILLLNSVRWLIGIYFVWPHFFSYKLYGT